MGAPKDANDIWTKDWTVAKFADELADYDTLYVRETAPTLAERYGSLFAGGKVEPYTLCRVEKTGGGVSLVPAPCPPG